jgi:hypothetical protein
MREDSFHAYIEDMIERKKILFLSYGSHRITTERQK